MDGKFITLILNLFAALSAIAAVGGLIALFTRGSEADPVGPLMLIFGGLFSYAVLSALVLIVMNLVQIRKNTEHVTE